MLPSYVPALPDGTGKQITIPYSYWYGFF
jgi:hypothetical protein